jgi:hypothetical protein
LVKATFTLENLSGIGFDAAIRAGATSIGSCVGNENAASGLAMYAENPSYFSSASSDLSKAKKFIPPGAKISIVISLACGTLGKPTAVDVSLALVISSGDTTFDMPLSVSDVPVR